MMPGGTQRKRAWGEIIIIRVLSIIEKITKEFSYKIFFYYYKKKIYKKAYIE